MEFWVLILTVWAFFRWVLTHLRRRKEDERFANVVEALNQFEARFREVTRLEKRVHELEEKLASSGSAAAPPTATAIQAQSQSPAALVEHPSVVVPPAIEIPKLIIPPGPAVPIPPASPVTDAVHPPAPKPPIPVVPAAPTIPRLPTAVPPARPFSPPPKAAPVSARELSSQLEETLGKNWLNKLGIIALVIGISLFLAYKFPSLSNPEKIGLGYLVSLVILGTGIYLERSDRYRVFSRALIGGGWALTFFVTYAMYFVPYTRVIDTEWVDLLLLFAVAGAMVVHTLRYDSQVVTGLAFLLAFTTVAISQNTIYSLSAGAILALGLVAIVHRKEWFALEVFGILASYINHYIWLNTIIAPMAGHHRMFPEFVPSTVLLCLYWSTYRWSYMARRVQTATQENISTLAAILNTALLLGLFKYQSVRPELAFYALLLLGAVELTLGQLPVTRRRRTAFIILSTIGILLLVAAIPFKYSGMDTAVIWLAEAEMLILAGVFTSEVLFRRFGLLVALLTSGDMLINQALPALAHIASPFGGAVFGISAQTASASGAQLAVSFLVAALLFYGDALVIPRRWKELFTSESESVLFRALSYLGGMMLFVAVWLAVEDAWTAVVWLGVALTLVILARTFSVADLTYQAHLFALAGVWRAFAVNYFLTTAFWGSRVSVRLVTLCLVIALLYLCARQLTAQAEDLAIDASEFYTTAAAIVFVALAYRECAWAWVAVAWGGFALVLAVLGIRIERRDLSLQAHLLVLAGFVRTLVVNIDAREEWHHFTVRFVTFTVMAALLYLCAYFSGPRDSVYKRLFAALHTWAGSILIAVLAFLEVSSPWIAVAWAVFALLLLITANRVKSRQLHFQAYILSVAALFQIVTVNLAAAGAWSLYPRVSLRLISVGLVAGIFYLCARWAAKGEFARAAFAGVAYTWAASSLVVVLAGDELGAHAVALGWALFGLLLFEIGMQWRSRNWRLQGYVVLGLSFLRLASVNSAFAPHELVLTTLPIALVFYFVYVRLRLLEGARDQGIPTGEARGLAGASQDPFAFDRQIYADTVFVYLGTVTLALFANWYSTDALVLLAWAALSFVLIGVSWGSRQDVFMHQSVLMAFVVFFRGLSYELAGWGRPNSPWHADRVFCVAASAAILFAAQAWAFPLRRRLRAAASKRAGGGQLDNTFGQLWRRPEQIYFFLPMILVTFLALNEIAPGRVTIVWGIEAVAAFLFALMVGERSFRLAGLGLLLVCVARIVLLDVWRQERSDRFVTFIILGVALLLVSYLYTRYSEAIRRYL